MAKAIGETERRREKQQKYNEEHGITPQGLNKKVVDLAFRQRLLKPKRRAEENRDRLLSRIMCPMDMSRKALSRKSMSWKRLMMQHAQNLEFEEAAQIRDQLHQLRELFIAAS